MRIKSARLDCRRSLALVFWMLASVIGQADDKDLKYHEIPVEDDARIKTRIACSCIFVQEMSTEQCLDGADEIYRYLALTSPTIPQSTARRLNITVTTSGGIVQLVDQGKVVGQSEYLDDGGGCVTGIPGEKGPLISLKTYVEPPKSEEPLPRGALLESVDKEALDNSLRIGFSVDGPLRGYTRAVLIVHNNEVVEERYAPGFGPHHKYYLGSVAKIFNNLLAGLLVSDGKLEVNESVSLPEWRKAGDPRAKITFDHMLHMTSGLAWEEKFFKPGAPGYNVFFAGPESLDAANYVGRSQLEADPGTHYEYSTGASILLGHALQWRISDHGYAGRSETLHYLMSNLLRPIGATGIVMEFDRAETLLTGEAVYAHPEALARVGLLLLNDGRWQGKQILPEGWLQYSTDIELAKSEDHPYGAQLELDFVAPECFGHTGVGGQKLIVCPSRNLVVVWFASDFDFFGWQDYSELRAAYDRLLDIQRQLVQAFPAVDDNDHDG